MASGSFRLRLLSIVPEAARPAVRRVYRRFRGRSGDPVTGAPGRESRTARGPAAVRSREELHAFWRDPDEVNRPERYTRVAARSRFLVNLMEWYGTPHDRVLEIGPNVGRNLEHLRLAGYERLEGIEISERAVTALRATYKELAALATIHNAPVEDVIREIPDASFDVIFTMAVLEHIHPESEWIFAEMVRICRRMLITIEDEAGRSSHHTPRNYRSVFEGLGLEQIAEIDPLGLDDLPREFRARVFVREDTERV